MKIRFPRSTRFATLAVCAIAPALIAAGCGDDEEATTDAAATSESGELAAVKDYLVEHATDLDAEVEILTTNAEEYYELAEAAGFDYEALMQESGDEVQRILADSQEAYVAANPAYEEMEGIVAGVPRLAQYDVDIDAGAAASEDPEGAVSFSLDLPNGETLKQPGNLFGLVETTLYGTSSNPALLADVPQDVDLDGQVEFGEGIPNAESYVATLREFKSQTEALLADAEAFEPTPSDAFTAITIMTPTMSEYFEAWKNSRFIAGEKADEEAFVATSRLSDIADILSGIQFTYAEIEPTIAAEDPEAAEQTGAQLDELLAYVEDLEAREADGEEFTGEDADTLGSEAQSRAEEIAGQVTQAAQQLGIELQDA